MSEWAAFEQIEGPILLHQRLDFAAAMISFVVARSAGSKRTKLTDFIPQWDRHIPRSSDDDVARTIGELMEAASHPSPPSS